MESGAVEAEAVQVGHEAVFDASAIQAVAVRDEVELPTRSTSTIREETRSTSCSYTSKSAGKAQCQVFYA